jgi:hypothetical protein
VLLLLECGSDRLLSQTDGWTDLTEGAVAKEMKEEKITARPMQFAEDVLDEMDE